MKDGIMSGHEVTYIGPVENKTTHNRAEMYRTDDGLYYVTETSWNGIGWDDKRQSFESMANLLMYYNIAPVSMPETDGSESSTTAKADTGKPRISLVPPQIIYDICEVREYGNRKYHDPNNWRTVEAQRYVDALLRHTLAFMENPRGKDAESGIEHYKHMACNLAFLCEMWKEDTDA